MRCIVRRFIFLLFLLLLAEYRVVFAETNTWTTLGPEIQHVSVLAIDPVNPRTIYAGNNGDGTGVHVFKSTDGGLHWNDASQGLPSGPFPQVGYWRWLAITALVIDPQYPDTVYAAIVNIYGTTAGVVRDSPAIFKSTDGGANWNGSDSGLPDESFKNGSTALAIDPRNPNTLYAATGASVTSGLSIQVFKSTNGGASWNRAGDSRSVVNDYLLDNIHASLAIDPQNPDTVYLGLYGAGILKTTDGGKTWSEPNPGPIVKLSVTDLPPSRLMQGALKAVTMVAIDPRNPTIVYAATSNLCFCLDDPIGTGVWKSTDAGATWSAVNVGLTTISTTFPGPIHSLVIHPRTAGTLYASVYAGGVFKSIDGGENWSAFNAGLSGENGSQLVSTLALTSSGPAVLYAGSSQRGISRITDEMPVLSVESASCSISPWKLIVSNGPPDTPIGLTGTSNGQLWEIAAWRRTDGVGGFIEQGVFDDSTVGIHTLTVDIEGAHSNSVSFVVSRCIP